MIVIISINHHGLWIHPPASRRLYPAGSIQALDKEEAQLLISDISQAVFRNESKTYL